MCLLPPRVPATTSVEARHGRHYIRDLQALGTTLHKGSVVVLDCEILTHFRRALRLSHELKQVETVKRPRSGNHRPSPFRPSV